MDNNLNSQDQQNNILRNNDPHNSNEGSVSGIKKCEDLADNSGRITAEEAKREPWKADPVDMTLGERLRKWKSRNEKNGFRFVTVKIIYPLVYTANRLRPIEKNKILFVEPSQLKPTNSMKHMLEEARKLDGYNVKMMSLGHNHVRKRYQLMREIKFLKEYATAKYVFTTEALATVGGFSKRKGTTVVQLWHGCGAFKRFGLSTADYRFGSNLATKKKYPDYRNEDIITVSSPEVVWAYEEAMDYEGQGVVQATGISRTDVFFDKEYVEAACGRVYAKIAELESVAVSEGEAAAQTPEGVREPAKRRKVILYAPTFRGRVKTATGPDEMDIEMMKRELGDEYVLLIKHHPHVKERPPVPENCKDFAWDVTDDLTIDDLICAADVCI